MDSWFNISSDDGNDTFIVFLSFCGFGSENIFMEVALFCIMSGTFEWRSGCWSRLLATLILDIVECTDSAVFCDVVVALVGLPLWILSVSFGSSECFPPAPPLLSRDPEILYVVNILLVFVSFWMGMLNQLMHYVTTNENFWKYFTIFFLLCIIKQFKCYHSTHNNKKKIYN